MVWKQCNQAVDIPYKTFEPTIIEGEGEFGCFQISIEGEDAGNLGELVSQVLFHSHQMGLLHPSPPLAPRASLSQRSHNLELGGSSRLSDNFKNTEETL